MSPSRNPRVSVYANERGVARALAERVADAIAAKPRLVLGLPTGRTPVLLYRELALLHMEGRIDFSRVTTFNLDEFLGVSGATIRAATARSCSSTCSAASTCRPTACTS